MGLQENQRFSPAFMQRYKFSKIALLHLNNTTILRLVNNSSKKLLFIVMAIIYDDFEENLENNMWIIMFITNILMVLQHIQDIWVQHSRFRYPYFEILTLLKKEPSPILSNTLYSENKGLKRAISCLDANDIRLRIAVQNDGSAQSNNDDLSFDFIRTLPMGSAATNEMVNDGVFDHDRDGTLKFVGDMFNGNLGHVFESCYYKSMLITILS
ncbi:hypothetical protein NQ317_011385 [Molorchus minor]|uniref:Uncharacterized protein n=1 Tax=Molorchus minor TaxID=1323400 RepID=A0ABQ9JTN5_9CUCU|nr:hypothetical protein NQ317_011385 [Molorchus minor]